MKGFPTFNSFDKIRIPPHAAGGVFCDVGRVIAGRQAFDLNVALVIGDRSPGHAALDNTHHLLGDIVADRFADDANGDGAGL